MINYEQPKDADGNVIAIPDWGFLSEKTITFDGGTENAWGDHDGDLDGKAVFEVTGAVKARVFAVVETDLVGGATIELGVSGATAAVLPQVADATGMDAREIWHMTDGTVDSQVEAITVSPEKIITSDMILTLTTANITAGVLKFVCWWYPMTEEGEVVASSL